MQNFSNEELVKIAGQTGVGTISGLKSQEAQAELNKRLIESLKNLSNKLDESAQDTEKYNFVIVNLTIAMMFLAVVQVVVSVLALNATWLIRGLYVLIALVVIVLTLKNMKKRSRSKTKDK